MRKVMKVCEKATARETVEQEHAKEVSKKIGKK
jgi:hypothetical protein